MNKSEIEKPVEEVRSYWKEIMITALSRTWLLSTDNNSLNIISTDNKLLNILANAAFYNRIGDLIRNESSELNKEVILHSWMSLIEALHWVFKTKHKTYQIPDWKKRKKQQQEAIKAYGTYILGLLNFYKAIGDHIALLPESPWKLPSYGKNFDYATYFCESCWELLQDSCDDCTKKIKRKSLITTRHSKIIGTLRKKNNPYSKKNCEKRLCLYRPYLYKAHRLALRYSKLYPQTVAFNKEWENYLQAYTCFKNDMLENSAWVCLSIGEKNRKKRIEHYLPEKGAATQPLYSPSGEFIQQRF